MACIAKTQKIKMTPEERKERQKIAMQKYRAANRAKIYETSKRYKKERIEREPKYLELLQTQSMECYLRRRAEVARGEETPKRTYVRTPKTPPPLGESDIELLVKSDIEK